MVRRRVGATNRGVWIVVDGMVLDVKRWLPEHPGGDRIIPAQSLNAEAARHFELYHSSKVMRLPLSLQNALSSPSPSSLSLSVYRLSLPLCIDSPSLSV